MTGRNYRFFVHEKKTHINAENEDCQSTEYAAYNTADGCM
jgi:hypothetical protein